MERVVWSSSNCAFTVPGMPQKVGKKPLSARPISIGFTRGKGHPCVFWHSEKWIKTLVHGDDYVSTGAVEAMSWLEAELEKQWELEESAEAREEGWRMENWPWQTEDYLR